MILCALQRERLSSTKRVTAVKELLTTGRAKTTSYSFFQALNVCPTCLYVLKIKDSVIIKKYKLTLKLNIYFNVLFSSSIRCWRPTPYDILKRSSV